MKNNQINNLQINNVKTVNDHASFSILSNAVFLEHKNSIGNISNENQLSYLSPPRVMSTSPLNGSTQVRTTKLVSISFSRLIYNPNHQLIQLRNSNGAIVPIIYSIKYNTLYLDHSPLKKSSTYTLTLEPNCVTDRTGKGFESTYTIKFQTGTNNINNFKARLIIPKLGLNALISSATYNAYNTVYHYPNSAYFGTPGECAMIGHRTTWSAPLRHIDLLNNKDLIIIKDYTNNKKCIYRFEYAEVKMNYELTTNFKRQGPCTLILKSCYPVGRSYAKYIVYSKLISTTSLV